MIFIQRFFLGRKNFWCIYKNINQNFRIMHIYLSSQMLQIKLQIDIFFGNNQT